MDTAERKSIAFQRESRQHHYSAHYETLNRRSSLSEWRNLYGYYYKIIFHKVDTSTNPYGIDPTMYTIDPSMVNK